MSHELILVTILTVTAAAFIIGKLEIDFIAIITLAFLTTFGFVTPDQAFNGFGSSTVITIACLFAVAGALRRSGIAELFAATAQFLVGSSILGALLLILLTSTLLSSVLNNIAVVAILLPGVLAYAARTKVPSSVLLLPLSFGALLGGMLTPFGTPPNMIAIELFKQRGIIPLTFSDFLNYGLPVALAGAVITLVLSPFLLERKKTDSDGEAPISAPDAHGVKEALAQLSVSYGSKLSGKTLYEMHFAEVLGAPVIAISRGGKIIPTPPRSEKLFSGDVVTLVSSSLVDERLSLFQELSFVPREELAIARVTSEIALQIDKRFVVASTKEQNHELLLIYKENLEKCLGSNFESLDTTLTALEVRGSLLGRRERLIKAFEGLLNFVVGDGQGVLFAIGEKEQVQFLSYFHELKFAKASEDITLETSDTTLIEAALSPRSRLIGKSIGELQFRERFDFSIISVWRRGKVIRERLGELKFEFGDALLLMGPRQKVSILSQNSDFVSFVSPSLSPSRKDFWCSIGALILLLVMSIYFAIPIHLAACSAVLFLLATKVMVLSDVYREIDWRVIVMVGALLPLGEVFRDPAIVNSLQSLSHKYFDPLQPQVVALLLILLASFFSQILEASVSVFLLLPLAIEFAAFFGISPVPFGMAVTIGSSIGFLAPFSHRAHLLVVSPGGYRGKHFLFVGLPVTIVTVLVLWRITVGMIGG